ncbi:hypothetical protein BD289DRAFT_487197 [Coniella lustricola]|uniref:Uncharacterized protein n=1 Tax=Coniella lustricola TaxID=2025994 RepID=A0A2T2ZSK6_9PEZI|nr:hypothetical protein BD289DRAFT_487197 [Coniella lustricola]
MSDEVSNFLRSVEQLNQGRDENEEARSRELEEKILQQRRERQARREERARSISPQKSSPAHTPPPSARRKDSTAHVAEALSASSPIPDLSAALQSHIITSPSIEAMDLSPTHSGSPRKEAEDPLDLDLKRSSASYTSPPPSAGLARTPTLSWQRRPPSQGPGTRSRPLSMVAAENAAVRSSESTSPERTLSRDQISQALSSKDPTWFRQTADRGASSAAYRKSQLEDPDTVDVHSGRTQLAGMSRSKSTEPDRDAGRDKSRSRSHSRLGSPLLPMSDAQKLGPPADIEGGGEGSTSGPPSPTRPASPTKGMGGFVQSAMMKRTDSVKRWSVTTPGLHRPTPSMDRTKTDIPGPETTSRPASRGKESSSRPTSSHAKEAPSFTTTDSPLLKGGPAASPKPENTRLEVETEQVLPTSPSRTMDPRRWSPTKSSWLEAALKQPESPKPKPAANNNQPSWMVELNKAKAARAKNGSADIDRGIPVVKKHEVKTGGLVRPAPLGTTVKPPGLGSINSPSVGAEKPLTPGLRTGGISRSTMVGTPSPTADKPVTPTTDKPVTPTTDKPTTPAAFKSEVSKTPVIGSLNPPTEELARRGSVAGHEQGKEKQETPKSDFRANLRQRGTTLGNADKPGSNNELASVFGKLRKTTTQNYVAPDELKENILRGKSGLNMTGGPRPYVKKDEFKDAILARKADFQHAKEEGRGVATNVKPPQEKAVPEGIARRATITSRPKSISIPRDAPMPKFSSPEQATKPLPSPKPVEAAQPSPPSSIAREETAPKQESTIPRALPDLSKEPGAPGKLSSKIGGNALANRFNPALAGLLARGPPGAGGPASGSSGTTLDRGASDEPAQGPQLTHMTKNRARGPRRKAPAIASNPSTSAASEAAASPTPEIATTPTARSPTVREESELFTEAPVTSPIEVTKGFFTKDKQQNSGLNSPVDAPKTPIEQQFSASRPSSTANSPRKMFEQISAKVQPVEEAKAAEPVRRSPSPRKLDAKRMSLFLDEPSQTSPKPEARASKPSSPVKRMSQFLSEQNLPSPQNEPAAPTKSESPTKPMSPVRRMSKLLDESSQSSQKMEPEPSKPLSPIKRLSQFSNEAIPLSPAPESEVQKPLSPVKKLSEPLEEPSEPPPQKEPLSPVQKYSQQLAESNEPVPQEESELPKPLSPLPSIERASAPQEPSVSDEFDSQPPVPVKDSPAISAEPVVPPKSPQQQAKTLPLVPEPIAEPTAAFIAEPATSTVTSPVKTLPPAPLSIEPSVVSTPSSVLSPTRSPSKSGSDVSAMLRDFFGSERPKRDYRADAGEILTSRPQGDAIVQTQKAQLFQITGQGKIIPVPSHYERMLFESEMYLCAHTYTNAARQKIQEVYFWAGDEVAPSAADDAQVFANREARAMGGPLVRLSQGKETAEFIQALGGIIIIRRGSSNKYDSLASNMLCGRQYVGQIVFDEVDFASTALCSGFPYIITQAGQCYLWKGKGSGIDELSCAKLIGMDSALMGEVIEIEEGQEPEHFWNLFGGAKKMSSADHWRLKPNYDKYRGRLFCSDAASRKQIIEINPFSQSDLSPTKIYVLDAFFEMYIIVGKHAQAEYASFHNALDFAQEYAILAAGMEDRPFVPVSTVVLEGIPRDMKSCFRKWRDDMSPTRMVVGSNNAAASGSTGGGPGVGGRPMTLKRARSLKIVPLGQALQVLGNSE